MNRIPWPPPPRDPTPERIDYLMKKKASYKRAKKKADKKCIDCKIDPLTEEEEKELTDYAKFLFDKYHPKP